MFDKKEDRVPSGVQGKKKIALSQVSLETFGEEEPQRCGTKTAKRKRKKSAKSEVALEKGSDLISVAQKKRRGISLRLAGNVHDKKRVARGAKTHE